VDAVRGGPPQSRTHDDPPALMARGRLTTGGVTAPVVGTRRAKSGARATKLTTQTSILDNVNRKETKR
jgi:hypothetical protein